MKKNSEQTSSFARLEQKGIQKLSISEQMYITGGHNVAGLQEEAEDAKAKIRIGIRIGKLYIGIEIDTGDKK